MIRNLDLGVMTLEKAVVELRHPPALALWDRAGSLWRKMEKVLPGIAMLEAQPNATLFRLPPNNDFNVELEVHRLAAASPDRKLTEFKKHADQFSKIVLETLEINQLSRIGLRLIYSMRTKSRDEAADLVLAKGAIRIPKSLGDTPPFAGRLSLPEAAFRWEGKALGISYRMRAETRNFDLSVPPGFPSDLARSVKQEINYATLDLDYYTTVKMARDQLVLTDWIESGLRVLKREADRMLGETIER